MTAMARRRDESLTPAFLAALALHLGLLAWITFFPQPTSIMPMGTAVPINIVSSAPVTDSRKAEAAPTVQEAQTEAPVAQAKAPEPRAAAARPTPPRPTPVPTVAKIAPALKPAPPKPAPPAKAQPTTQPLSLDALQASLAKSAHAAPTHPAFAKRGMAQIETDLQARVDAGHGVSQSDQAGLQQLLERLWNPNCAVEGANAVIVPVRFHVGVDGRVDSRVSAGGRESSSDPTLAAAARRAIDAVHQGEPYKLALRNQSQPFTVNFNAKSACAGH